MEHRNNVVTSQVVNETLHNMPEYDRLMESIEQTNHVLINVRTAYNPRLMAIQIRAYFQANPNAIEVLVYKGNKAIVITRRIASNPLFLIQFRRKYER